MNSQPPSPAPDDARVSERASHVTYHPDVVQGTEEWHAMRCGLLTASEMKLIITPTLKIASNDKERTHLYELMAQRISRYVEPHYVSDDMLRGQEDEIEAKALYSKHCAPVQDMGFITNDRWGFTIGYSPDALIGDIGLLECKSRGQRFQVRTAVECVRTQEAPDDYLMQIQTGLLVAEREWLDFVSFSGGLPMIVIRVYPDEEVQNAIVEVAEAFELRLSRKMDEYQAIIAARKFLPTERRIEQEMHI